MPAGLHWEWRGFGEEDPRIRERIEALPSAYPDSPGPAHFLDRYFWIPGCPINVKVRQGPESGLKFKRIHRQAGDLELWEERPGELYPFPLEPAAVLQLARELDLELARKPTSSVGGESELLALLEGSRPPVHAITVEKLRQGHLHRVEIDGEEIPVIVELAEILVPEKLLSVGIEECSRLEADSSPADTERARLAVERVVEELGLPGSMQAISYLGKLSGWVGP